MSESGVEPVIDPTSGQSLRADMAVRVGTFLGGESQHGLWAGEVVEQLLWFRLGFPITGEEQVIGRVADQDRAGNPLGDAVART